MARIFKTSGSQPSAVAIEGAAATLRAGGVALFPTETVYGLGVALKAASGRPGDAGRIFDIKRRDRAQVLPWLVSGVDDLDVYGSDVPEAARELARAFWPGGLTLVVSASSAVPHAFRAADGTIALRASASPVVAALIRACRCPLPTTSANTHGAPAPASFEQVERRIVDEAGVSVDAGACACGESSTIVSFAGPQPVVARVGAVPVAEVARVLGRAPEVTA